MCGRFQLSTDAQAIIDAYGVVRDELGEWPPRYNVAPSQTIPIVRIRDGERTLSGAHWGLLPHWAEERKIGYRMINARAETVAQLRSYRGPIRKSRCIVPADGWYEWHKENGRKQPYHFRLESGLAAFAGLWTWNARLELLSCSIIVTAANAAAAGIHDRMPVVLPQHAIDTYLDHDTELDHVLRLLRPYEGNDLRLTRVSRYVSNAANEGPECIAPAETAGGIRS